MDSLLTDFFTIDRIFSVILSLVTVVIIFLVEKISKRTISSFCHRTELERHVENILVFVSRIILYSIGIASILGIWGLPSEWLISFSALSGVAIGFASAQTMGNFLAGLYIMITRPFMVSDYVRIGNTEGEVREITMNYVKIYTPTYTITNIPNKIVLDSIIHRFMSNDMISYSYSMSFAEKIWSTAWVSYSDLLEKVIMPAIEEFWEKYSQQLPRKPEFSLSEIGHMNRNIMMRIFVPKGKVDLLYNLQPKLQESILNHLDEYRKLRETS